MQIFFFFANELTKITIAVFHRVLLKKSLCVNKTQFNFKACQ